MVGRLPPSSDSLQPFPEYSKMLEKSQNGDDVKGANINCFSFISVQWAQSHLFAKIDFFDFDKKSSWSAGANQRIVTPPRLLEF